MAGFNFANTAGASQSSFKPSLPGNEIHTVTFEGAEAPEFQGKKDPTMNYKVLRLKFSNEHGIFEHTIFEPREQDFQRSENEFERDGSINKIPTPSNVESFMLLLKHLIDSVLPELSAKIDSGEAQLGGKDWDQLRSNMIKILEKGIGVETSIKLINDSKGEPRFPGFFAAINKEGKAYVRNNFIGKNLGFTAYEKTRIKNQTTAKPTNTDSFDIEPVEVGSLDMDFDVSNL